MKILKLIPIILLLVINTANESFAQKVGHLNAEELLISLPEMKAANSQLETFRKQKLEAGKTKAVEIEKFYFETTKEIQEGTLSPMQQQQKELDLQRKQQELQKFEADAQAAIMKKQQELYQPIIDKVNGAIKKVAESNNYDYIFDTSKGIVIHFKDSDDVTELVRKAL